MSTPSVERLRKGLPFDSRGLSRLYASAHDRMRDVEGLLPQEAFDELLKYLVYRDCADGPESVVSRRRVPESAGAIRQALANELDARIPWAQRLWPGGHFHVSDQTLSDLHALFAEIPLRDLAIDVRSTALWTFLTPELRKSLGIFTTPEEIVRMMVETVAPKRGDVVLDPACGTGTFLMEVLRFVLEDGRLDERFPVYGVDKNPRMLVLAGLNLGEKVGTAFHRACADSLRDFGDKSEPPLGLRPNSVDIILTNPPFGVSVSHDTGIPDLFDTGSLGVRKDTSKVPSEILFVELCLRLLKPDGRLGIVLPRSVMTNERIARQRHAIDQLGRLTELVDLPPETFVSTGTQTTTVAAFFRKHAVGRRDEPVDVRVCRVTNVGFDGTGRPREGSELPQLAGRLRNPARSEGPPLNVHSRVPATETMQRAAGFLFRRNGVRSGKALGEFIAEANTGQTPSRAAYSDAGMFILKVGNLTGRGIDWTPRNRNFVSQAQRAKRARNPRLELRRGDILLTSSAHAAQYIAKKVDIVAEVPDELDGLTFVGELIRIRAVEGVDPYLLLAAMRHPQVREDLQAAVRGQTAHLNPADLLQVTAPCDLARPDDYLLCVAGLLRTEADIARRLGSVAAEADRLLRSPSATAV